MRHTVRCAVCDTGFMQTSPTSEDSIRSLLEEQVAAWNAGDAQAWCKDFTPDAEFVNILGMHFRGRDANARRHEELFASIFKGSHLEIQDVKVRILENSTAIAGAIFDLMHFRRLPPGIRPTQGSGLLRTRMHYVMICEASRWRIVFSQNTAVMPTLPVE